MATNSFNNCFCSMRELDVVFEACFHLLPLYFCAVLSKSGHFQLVVLKAGGFPCTPYKFQIYIRVTTSALRHSSPPTKSHAIIAFSHGLNRGTTKELPPSKCFKILSTTGFSMSLISRVSRKHAIARNSKQNNKI